MRTPFVRPFFANFFYWYAGVSTAFGVLITLLFPTVFRRIIGPDLGLYLNTASGFLVIIMLAQGAAVAAIGYVIELLAKIEWNTRPSTAEMGYAIEPARATASSSLNKQYFLSEKGRVTGPLNGAEVLALYRDGKISNAAQIAVEENGQRRLVKNLSEIGL